MTYLMEVPVGLVKKIMAGAALVDGAMVKDTATGRVLGHLQQTQKLATTFSSGPAGAAAAVVDAGSSLAQNIQLEQIKGMLSTLQVVAGVGAAASILNLGVSVGGFVLVLRRLDKIEERISSVGEAVDAVNSRLKRTELARLRTALDRCENAHRRNASDCERVWRDEERVLDEAAALALSEVEDLADKDEAGHLKLWETDLDARQIAARLELPLLCIQTRLEALLLLNNPDEARRVAEKLRAWLSLLDVSPIDYVKHRRKSIPLGSREIAAVTNEAVSLQAVFRRATLQARDRAAFCEAIIEKRLDSRRIVEEVRDHSDPTVLILPISEVE